MTYLIVAIAALAGGIAVYIAMRFWMHLDRRISDLEKVQEQPKRHTMSTVAGLEDAIAVAIDLTFKQQADQERLRSLLEILQTLRSGPRVYNPDRPSGRRPANYED